MGYTITFSDVMTVVISGALTIIVWFLKSYLSNIQATNEQQNKKLAEIDEKTQRRINAVEEVSRNEIKRVDRELADIRGDFATMFVLREDYFRAMDKMDGNFRDIDRKIDRLLIANNITMEVKSNGRPGEDRGESEQIEPRVHYAEPGKRIQLLRLCPQSVKCNDVRRADLHPGHLQAAGLSGICRICQIYRQEDQLIHSLPERRGGTADQGGH